MAENHHVGSKFLWVGTDGVLEMHGREKLSWTHLEEHIFRDNVPVEQLRWKQYRWSSFDKSGATRSGFKTPIYDINLFAPCLVWPRRLVSTNH